jgi:predicted TIM-barrel fold metal-dependent hydrolase
MDFQLRPRLMRKFVSSRWLVLLVLGLGGVSLSISQSASLGLRRPTSVDADTIRPVVDYHQHLVSSAGAVAQNRAFPTASGQPTIRAADLIELLDDAGIKRAVVLSDAFWFDSKRDEPSPQSYAEVRAENDWTAAEIAKFPKRLVGFCSFNPLREYAIVELERCARTTSFTGVKLHFGTSGVDLKNPTHLASLRRVFGEANSRRLPIVVHVRADQSYGREHAEILLNRVLPMAPDVVVQIAHLWGGGAYSESALAVYADAVSSRHLATKNLYFDVSDAALVAKGSPKMLNAIAARIRQIGPRRVLYGSDAGGGHPPPREAWAAFRTQTPLTEEEFRIIAGNLAPYLR